MDEFRKSSLLFLLMFSLLIRPISSATDTLDTSRSIRDGETLVSSGGMFELGFFSPGNSTNRYVGIWYKNITVQTAVWVANRGVPLPTKSGVLRVAEPGILALFNHTNGIIIWSSNVSRSVGNPAAQLLDSGNLVVKDADSDTPENFLWQSFDYPSDSSLSGMSLGWNFVTGVETYFTSWRSDDDPAPGEFTSHLDPAGYPQLVQKRLGVLLSRAGPWNGVRFSGAPGTRNDPKIRVNKNEVKYEEDAADPWLATRLRLSPTGSVQRWTWNDQTNAWAIYNATPDVCDDYNSCGANGICKIGNSPRCGCLDRFVVKDRERSNGCVRRTPLKCGDDVFLKYSGIKLPDARYASFDDRRLMLDDCKEVCARNCSCTAYTQLDIREEESGCLFYYGDLIDIRTLDQDGGDLYIRISSTELDSEGEKRVLVIASSTLVAGVFLLCMILILFYAHKRKKRMRKNGPFYGSDGDEAELPFFNLSSILKATDNFSIVNKLGQGGFGPVYKGMLEDGQEIAVKRMSETSSQGVKEFKNEVLLIAKLQHRNLVRLLGSCIQGEEKMLIYEYMPNNSLDSILFDETKSRSLNWQMRFQIINGIAKGLLYLHQDSRLRIIHRDLKASNILLDADMNPKISDFGLARSFGGNESEVQTRRVVGTYGYMSPEYAADGLFSVKSDVFSFGVLVLEVASGMRNRGFFINDCRLNLLRYAWTLYKEDKSCELVDDSLGDSCDSCEVLRSIHVGLLCVQNFPEDRPSMSSVVFMLGSEVPLPEAKQPAFFAESQSIINTNASSCSANQATITLLAGR